MVCLRDRTKEGRREISHSIIFTVELPDISSQTGATEPHSRRIILSSTQSHHLLVWPVVPLVVSKKLVFFLQNAQSVLVGRKMKDRSLDQEK